MKTLNDRSTIVTDDYGRIPYELFRKLRRANVSPADWDNIVDAYEIIAQTRVDYEQAMSWINGHTSGGIYIEPWPLNPVDIVNYGGQP